MNFEYQVWMTTVSDALHINIVNELLKHGLSVKSAHHTTMSKKHKDHLSAILAIVVSSDTINDASKITELLRTIICQVDVVCYSIIVATRPHSGISWSLGNANLKELMSK